MEAGVIDEDDTLAQLEARLVRKLYVWLVVGGLAVGGVGGSGVLRVDKFGLSDYQIAEEKERERMEEYIEREIHHSVMTLDKRMPPYKTRQRIHALERHVEQEDPTYIVPVEGW
jgi:hypothetical protein